MEKLLASKFRRAKRRLRGGSAARTEKRESKSSVLALLHSAHEREAVEGIITLSLRRDTDPSPWAYGNCSQPCRCPSIVTADYFSHDTTRRRSWKETTMESSV